MNTLRSLVSIVSGRSVCWRRARAAAARQRLASDDEAAIANMNLGAGYLRQGNADLAIERLQRALAQNPRLVEAHSTIALAYDQIGSLEEAETHYQRATQLDPENARRGECLRRVPL